jgi:hypothetical protein
LRGGSGYHGTLTALDGPAAVVELDDEMVLDGGTWSDFGAGSATALRTVTSTRGRWLVLLQGSVGGTWSNHTSPVHVALCSDRPSLSAIPPGGGIGVWIESHATMTRLGASATN